MSKEKAVRVDDSVLLRIAEEVIAHSRWSDFVKYATDLYGDQAYEIEVSTSSQYDDEGGYFDTIEGITVKDRAGNVLAFDFSTEFWQQQLGDTRAEDREYAAEEIADDYKTELNPIPETFCADSPPPLSFKEFYAVPKDAS
jgi:hypothetical protein